MAREVNVTIRARDMANAVLREFRANVAAVGREMRAAFGDGAVAADKAETELKQAGIASANLDGIMGDLRADAAANRAAFAQMTTAVLQQSAALQALTVKYDALAQRQTRARALGRGMGGVEAGLAGLPLTAKQGAEAGVGASGGGVLASIARDSSAVFGAARASVNAFGSALGSVFRTLTSVRGLMASFGAIMVARGAIRVAAEFETPFVRLRGLLQLSRRDADELRGAVLRLGPETAKAPVELANAMFYIVSAGLRGKNALEALRVSAMASTAGLGDTKVVADALTSAINAYGEANLTAARAGAIMVATVREGKAEADTIAGSLGKVLPIAAQLGVKFEDLGAGIAALTRVGMTADESTTALRGMFIELIHPAEQAEVAMGKFGLSANLLRAELRERGLLAVLDRLKESVGDDTEAIGAMFPNARALTGLLQLVGANATQVTGIFERMGATTTAVLEDAAKAAGESAAVQFAKLHAEFQVTAIALGESLIPAVRALMEMFTSGGAVEFMRAFFGDLGAGLKGLTGAKTEVAAFGDVFIVAFKGAALAMATLVDAVQNIYRLFDQGGNKRIGELESEIAALEERLTPHTTGGARRRRNMNEEEAQSLALLIESKRAEIAATQSALGPAGNYRSAIEATSEALAVAERKLADYRAAKDQAAGGAAGGGTAGAAGAARVAVHGLEDDLMDVNEAIAAGAHELVPNLNFELKQLQAAVNDSLGGREALQHWDRTTDAMRDAFAKGRVLRREEARDQKAWGDAMVKQMNAEVGKLNNWVIDFDGDPLVAAVRRMNETIGQDLVDSQENATNIWGDFLKESGDLTVARARFVTQAIQSFASMVADFVGKILDEAFKGQIRTMKDVTRIARDLVQEFAKEMIKEIIRIAVTKAIVSGVAAIAAEGAVWRGGFTPVQSFAGGGVVTGPTVGVIGDNPSQVEAMVPMNDGHNIPVKILGNGTSGGNATVHLTVYAADARSVSDLMRGPDGRAMVKDLVAQAIRGDSRFRRVVLNGG